MTKKEQLEGKLHYEICNACGLSVSDSTETAAKLCMAVYESSLGEFAVWLGKNKWQRSPYPGFTGVWYKNDPYQTVKNESELVTLFLNREAEK